MRYFFHIQGVADSCDDEGLELPDMEAVRHEAIEGAREILSEEAGVGRDRADWTMLVTDETGKTVLRLPFSEVLQRA
jgi:hypothetical protein